MENSILNDTFLVSKRRDYSGHGSGEVQYPHVYNT